MEKWDISSEVQNETPTGLDHVSFPHLQNLSAELPMKLSQRKRDVTTRSWASYGDSFAMNDEVH